MRSQKLAAIIPLTLLAIVAKAETIPAETVGATLATAYSVPFEGYGNFQNGVSGIHSSPQAVCDARAAIIG